MFVAKVPPRMNTILGSLDSEIMTTETVETIISIFTETRSTSKVRKALLSYHNECVEKNKEYKNIWKRTH